MAKILISYRRADTAVFVGRVYDRLAAHYGRNALFLDVDDVPYGTDFRTHIADVMRGTDVVVGLIGAAWLGSSSIGVRIGEPADPVRVEIEAALEARIPIVPVLVDGAAMPSPEVLPASIRPLSYLNAVALSSGRDFDQHMQRLVSAIDATLGGKAPIASAMRAPIALDLRTPTPYVVAIGLALPMLVALLGAAPPGPGFGYATVVLEAALIAGLAFAMRAASRYALKVVLSSAGALLIFAAVLYLGLFSTFTFVTPGTGAHWVKGYVCTTEALARYEDKCPFLGIDQLRSVEFEAERLWTLPSIATVQTALTGAWFAAFVAIGALSASMLAGSRSNRRAS